MSRTRGWWRAGALMLAIALVAVACGDDDGNDNGDGDGGSESSQVVVGAEELPPVLNTISIDSTVWTSWIAGPALARGYKLLPDFTYEPWVFEDDCSIETEEPFTVSCRIREEAAWSDGTSITADDFQFTYETIVDPDNAVFTVTGYENITSFEVVSPTEFRMVFDGPYAPYRDLWAGTTTTILPKHVLEGEDFNTVWNDCICDPETGDPIASGPFLVESFTPEQEVTLTKNSDYWDGEAKVDEVVFVPTPDTDAEITALDGDDVQVIYPQETTELRERIEAIDDANLETGLGLSWEHLDLLTTTPGLDDVAVRRAIATALPRQDVVDTVARPVDDDASVQDNSIYVPTQPEYLPNWDLYPAEGDVGAANEILDAAGWTRQGDVRSRDGVELRFTIGTTAGDAGREQTQLIIQERLAEIGIVLTIDNSGAFFDRVDAFEYPMALFANESSPDPSWVHSVYPTDAPLNGTQQSNVEVDALLAEAIGETDPEARAGLLNTADEIMAEEVVSVIPLYQKPAALAYLDSVSGLRLNVTIDGFTWNIEEWERTG